MHLLAGDVGGTKTLLMLARIADGTTEILAEKRFASAEYPGIVPMIRELLAEAFAKSITIDAACFAIAGPVADDDGTQHARLTNVPWGLDSVAISSALGGAKIQLINDLAGIAHAIDVLLDNQRVVLQAGHRVARGQRLVVAPGTGFNSAVICPGEGAQHVLPAESGHAAFSPANARQLNLIRHVTERENRCSREHVLAGPGLPRLLDFVCKESGHPPGSALQQAMRFGDPSAAIGQAAITGGDGLAIAALELYAEILAGQIADLALGALPTGGVYLAGGVPAKVLPFLQTPRFLAALHARPPMTHLLEALHVEVVIDERIGLRGALEAARQLAMGD